MRQTASQREQVTNVERIPHVFILHTGELGAYLSGVPGYENPQAQLLALARALSVSSSWPQAGPKALVVRDSPQPVLGVMGHFDAAERARLEALRRQLADALPRWRYLTYAEVEGACEQLASHLRERFGRSELKRFRFTALPRGGLIVLGMLAYLLELDQSQLESPHPHDLPLVVVDDCAISGLRFGRFLEHHHGEPVIFAPLFSHPELRQAVEARESRVAACVSAQLTHDYAPDYYGDEYSAWKARWWKRSDPRAYWVGRPEQICFPWNEPDLAIWNPVTDQEERGWQLAPPELCLKNRPPADREPVPLQVQPLGKGPLRPSGQALYGELSGRVILANLATEESVALDEVGSDMWKAMVEYGNIDSAAAALAQEYDADEATLQADLRGLSDELIARGLLEHTA